MFHDERKQQEERRMKEPELQAADERRTSGAHAVGSAPHFRRLLMAKLALLLAAAALWPAEAGPMLANDGSGPPVRLPKINIYMNKQEVKKLLGIETRINYVINGYIDAYPLKFSIPLGYNQSDLIFTWQNLGQTNVNYSISLIIGNQKAVELPQINITRNGLIPKHEQMFKITLPCSGRLTAEVDVQVLIDISGFVEPEPPAEDELGGAPALGELEQPAAGAANASSAEPAGVQADEPAGAGVGEQLPAPPPALQPVSYKLAIKRRKICTMHPVPISVAPRVAPAAAGRKGHLSALPADAQPLPALQPPPPPPPPPPPQPQVLAAAARAEPKQQSHAKTASGAVLQHTQQTQQQQSAEPPMGAQPSVIDPSLFSAPPPPPPPPLAAPFPSWLAPSQGPRGPAPAGEPRSLAGHPAQRSQPAPAGEPAGSLGAQVSRGALLVSLLALSLLVSLAVGLVALFSASGGHSSSSAASALWAAAGGAAPHSPPRTGILHRLRAACRLSGSAKAPAGKNKQSSNAAGAGAKLAAGAHAQQRAGLATISGAGAHAAGKLPAGYYLAGKQAAYSPAGYYMGPAAYQQHYQPAPPTADLLGTGYQCQRPAPALPAPPQHPIYQLAPGGNPASQTTRLIWSNGKGADGFTPEGGAYVPLSDSGSLYQTIA